MASQQMGMGAQMGGQMPPLPTGAMPFQPAVSIFFSTIVYLDVLWMCSAYVFLFKYVSPRDLFQYSHTFQETMTGVSANLTMLRMRLRIHTYSRRRIIKAPRSLSHAVIRRCPLAIKIRFVFCACINCILVYFRGKPTCRCLFLMYGSGKLAI